MTTTEILEAKARPPVQSGRIVMWFFGFVALLFTVGALLITFRRPIQPEPTRVLNLTQFNRPEQIGAVLYRRYFFEIQNHPQTVIGLNGQVLGASRILAGFLRVAEQNGVHFDSVVYDSANQARLHAIAMDASIAKTLIVTDAGDAKLAEVQRLLPKAFVVSQALLPLSDDEKTGAKARCLQSKVDCLALLAARAGSSRGLKGELLTAVMMHQDQREILFVHEPAPK